MTQNAMWRPAVISGVLIGMLSAIPPFNLVNCVCCAWLIGGGMLAAHLYIRNSATVVTLGSGALLGALTGAIGGAASTLFGIPVQMLMRSVLAPYVDEVRRVVSDLPNVPPWFMDVINASAGHESPVVSALVSLPFSIVLYGAITTLGGVLGVAVFEKRKPGGSDASPPPADYIPPPPPPPSVPEP
jgi:hypothetical protein